MVSTICNMESPRFLQAGIPGPARRKGSVLGSSTDRGAAPAFTHETQLKDGVFWEQNLKCDFGFHLMVMRYISLDLTELFPFKFTGESTIELKLSENITVRLEITRAFFFPNIIVLYSSN